MSTVRAILSGGLLVAALALATGPAFSADQADSSAPAASSAGGPPQRINTPPKPGTSEDVIIAPEEKRATSPDGDPRSSAEIQADQMAYDQCVLRAPEPSIAHPVDSSPEEYCSQKLGMTSRNAIPNSVLQPRPKQGHRY